MKTILYLSAHNPYPARSGGQVDIWNRLQALKQLGHRVDLVLTVKKPLRPSERAALKDVVYRLTEVRRSSLLLGLFRRLPVQMAIRTALRTVPLASQQYDLALLDTEFTGEILHNPALHARHIVIRVHNDEAAYQRKLSQTCTRFFHRIYFRLEARAMARYIPRLWQQANALWFISSDELASFQSACKGSVDPSGRMLPAALNLHVAGKPALGTASVLFVGSLAVALNQDAIRWYLREIHPLLLDVPGYGFIVAGSTLGQTLTSFLAEVTSCPATTLHCDVPDLHALFEQSSVFVSPMRHGAGVKLKTVEAVLRGLPLVTTPVGAEGTGLQDGLHCCIAADAANFASAVRDLLQGGPEAVAMRDRAAEHVTRLYNHAEQLQLALDALL